MRTLIVFALALAMTWSSEARTVDNMLQGIQTLELLIAVDDQSKACGITEADVREVIMLPARSVGLNLLPTDPLSTDADSLGRPELIVGVGTKHGITVSQTDEKGNSSTLLYGDLCASSVQLTALIVQKVTIEATGYKATAAIILWREGGDVVAGHVSLHKFLVQGAVSELAKKFTMDWVLDKQQTQGKKPSVSKPR